MHTISTKDQTEHETTQQVLFLFEEQTAPNLFPVFKGKRTIIYSVLRRDSADHVIWGVLQKVLHITNHLTMF